MADRISLSGVPETMLQTLYARAEESRTRGAIHDEAAEALVSKLDYDFSIAKRDKAMRSGVIARTIVLDKLTKAFLASHPGAVVVNIACGLDTRCYRMTGFSHWYNLDLPETMAKLKFSFHPVILARTVAADPEGIDIRSYDVVGIYSPSEVKVLIEQFGDELPTIAAFGEATLRCAIEAGLTVKIKAPTPEAPSMVKAIDIYIDQVHAGKEVEAAQFVEDKQKEEFIRSQQHKLAKKSRARRSSADKK